MVKPVKIIRHSVIDGDTLIVRDVAGNEYRTRARWIDAPETRKSGEISRSEADLNQWQWGERSRSYLAELLKDQPLIIVPHNTDQYGRTLADWYLGRIRRSDNVQAKMCEAGMAVDLLPFDRYTLSSRDLTLYVAILRGQYNARSKKRGVWADPDFVIPSQWRLRLSA